MSFTIKCAFGFLIATATSTLAEDCVPTGDIIACDQAGTIAAAPQASGENESGSGTSGSGTCIATGDTLLCE